MTPVLFLKEKDGGDVFAYFPKEIWNGTDRTCYAHIGQHSACSQEYAKECEEAVTNDYMLTLLPELIRVGYKDLQIMNNQTITYHRPPTEAEIKFGHGATHYREFPLFSCVNPKTGDFKKWLKADNDGLRYYH